MAKFTDAHKKAHETYRKKALANITLIISHTEPDVMQALETIMSHHATTKAGAIKQALVAYQKQLLDT